MEAKPPNFRMAFGTHDPSCLTCHCMRVYLGKYTCIKYLASVPNGATCNDWAPRNDGSVEPTAYELEKLENETVGELRASLGSSV